LHYLVNESIDEDDFECDDEDDFDVDSEDDLTESYDEIFLRIIVFN
jgi:hypothetical protein